MRHKSFLWAFSRQKARTRAGIGLLASPPLCLALWLLGLVLTGPLAEAASEQLLSARSPAVPLPAGGNGGCDVIAVSPDGRFVLFGSMASDLAPGDKQGLSTDVYLRDRTANTTTLVSRNLNGTGGGNDHSTPDQVSADGRYVLFESHATNLVAGDTNRCADIFLRDLTAGTTLLVSVATNGGFLSTASQEPVMTPDARYVAFVSGTNVLVRDVSSPTTQLASIGLPTGATVSAIATPRMTPDGRFVAFAVSYSSGAGDIVVRDLLLNQTILASTNAAALAQPILGNSTFVSLNPVLSDDGRYVAFGVTRWDFPDTTGALILRYDAVAATTTVVSTSATLMLATNEGSFSPAMTPDGRFIAFVQRAGTTTFSSVHLWDAEGSPDTLVSGENGHWSTDTISHSPVLSPDGRFVAFLSDAPNLVTNSLVSGFHLYLRDLQAVAAVLVDVDTNGVGSTDNQGTQVTLSADGQFVAFTSPDGNLVNLDRNRATDVFVRDMMAGSTELISRREASLVPQSGDGLTLVRRSSTSADGRLVIFSSDADDLVPNDTNSARDVFVHDVVTGSNSLVSAGLDGNPALGGGSDWPIISANGRFVAFLSLATNLVGRPVSTNRNAYLRDLQTTTTTLLSVSTNGVTPGNGWSSDLVINQDGSAVAFLSYATNLTPPGPYGFSSRPFAYWRDVSSGTTRLLGTGSSLAPSLSDDGHYVSFLVSQPEYQVRVRDTQLGVDVYTNTVSSSTGIPAAWLSPTGARLLYKSNNTVLVDNILTGSNLLRFYGNASLQNSGAWSADGRYFVFATTSSGAMNQVFLGDLAAGTVSLLTSNYNGTARADGASDLPSLSGDGRFVLYRSWATDLVPSTPSPLPNVVLYDRLTGANSLVTTNQSETPFATWLCMPSLSRNGQTAVFLRADSTPLFSDFNRVPDAFASLLAPWTFADADGDGIPNWWMEQYFGHSMGQAGDQSFAWADPAGDGMSNLQKYQLGRNPLIWDNLHFIDCQRPLDGPTQLTFFGQVGHRYTLQGSTNLTDWVSLQTFDCTNNIMSVLDLGAENKACRFYRLAP